MQRLWTKGSYVPSSEADSNCFHRLSRCFLRSNEKEEPAHICDCFSGLRADFFTKRRIKRHAVNQVHLRERRMQLERDQTAGCRMQWTVWVFPGLAVLGERVAGLAPGIRVPNRTSAAPSSNAFIPFSLSRSPEWSRYSSWCSQKNAPSPIVVTPSGMTTSPRSRCILSKHHVQSQNRLCCSLCRPPVQTILIVSFMLMQFRLQQFADILICFTSVSLSIAYRIE